jgi:ComF family protein
MNDAKSKESGVIINEVAAHPYGAVTRLLDMIMPRICSVCNEILDDKEAVICHRCRSAFQSIPEPVCAICGSWLGKSKGRGKCVKCPRMGLYISATHVPFYYRGAMGDALRNFKYQGRIEMASPLAQAAFMAMLKRERVAGMSADEERSDPTGLCETIDVIAPVPLHFTRFLRRGYNQSELIGRDFAKIAGLEFDASLLCRVRPTPRQALLPAEKRYANVRGAFRVSQPDAVRGRRVAVFDDIMTTGHTINECARVLINAGATSVIALTIARA